MTAHASRKLHNRIVHYCHSCTLSVSHIISGKNRVHYTYAEREQHMMAGALVAYLVTSVRPSPKLMRKGCAVSAEHVTQEQRDTMLGDGQTQVAETRQNRRR